MLLNQASNNTHTNKEREHIALHIATPDLTDI